MTTAQHSPTPWKNGMVRDHYTPILDGTTTAPIALIEANGRPEWAANARLRRPRLQRP